MPSGIAAKSPVVEPEHRPVAEKTDPRRTLAQLDEALATADVLVMLVDQSQFKVINGDLLISCMSSMPKESGVMRKF
ncbi:hypothetical protein ACLK19_25490 [Escherichia coli]